MRLTKTLFLATLLALSGGQAAGAGKIGIAATVGERDISETELQNALNNHLRQSGIEVGAIRQPGKFNEIRARVLEVLIGQELLWQAAVENGSVATDAEVTQELERIRAQFEDELSFDNRIREGGHTRSSFRRDLKHRLSAQKWIRANIRVSVDDAEVEQFYQQNRQQFAIPEQVRASHILLQLNDASSDTDRKNARELLEKIRRQIDSGADFAALAREHSQDSSASRGGDLGYFTPGQMVEAFERAAFALAPGKISEIVETRFGLHLILVTDKLPPSFYAQREVAERIRNHLYQQKYEASIQATVDRLKGQTDIEIYY